MVHWGGQHQSSEGPWPSPALIRKLVQSKQMQTSPLTDEPEMQSQRTHWEMTDTYQRTKSLWTGYSQLPGALRCGFHTGEKRQDEMTSYRKAAWFRKPFQPVLQITRAARGGLMEFSRWVLWCKLLLKTASAGIRNLSRPRHSEHRNWLLSS